MADIKEDYHKASDEDVNGEPDDDSSSEDDKSDEYRKEMEEEERPTEVAMEGTEQKSSAVSNFLWKRLLPGAAIGTAAVLAAPLALTAVGFSAGGIIGGSYAAGMMSSAAIANGGGVAAGGLVAVLQSAGAAGISAAANVGIFSAGTIATASVVEAGSRIKDLVDEKKSEEKSSQQYQPM